MNSVSMYFEVHQPYRLRPYDFFDIGSSRLYLDDDKNRQIMRKVGDKCYIPTTNLLLDSIAEYGTDFRFTFSISGTAIEQMRAWYPEVLDNFKRLADTGQVEFLAETYYHSLASLFSDEEFRQQVTLHRDLIKTEFGIEPAAFRNTELIFSNHIASLVREMGFKAILLEGADRILDWRSPNFVYRHRYNPDLKCLLKNYRLSDDIAFRFSDRNWKEYPLYAEKFAEWVHSHAGSGEVFNLFMDFETFGEHQWSDSGIFDFLRSLPREIMKNPDFTFCTVSESATIYEPVGDIDSEQAISWADTERDVSAWLGNSLQHEAVRALYSLRKDVEKTGDEEKLRIFRLLTTSDHLYYMCTKYFTDGAVHKYFSPYDSPHDAYIYFMNILQDYRQRLKDTLAKGADVEAMQSESERMLASTNTSITSNVSFV